jgi:ubiquinone/menaquinone biosynthesis C-methylase UbiE
MTEPTTETAPNTVSWDYTDLAASYDKRADYVLSVIRDIASQRGLAEGTNVADLGAGTGKLTKVLVSIGLDVDAVEPNDAMREIGIRNLAETESRWHKGTAEVTGLPDTSFDAVFFGSSFNVVNQSRALEEATRLLRPGGHLCCMWNHRDLDDPLQMEIERIIASHIPGYAYGTRRQDPSDVIVESGLFEDVRAHTGTQTFDMPREDVMGAWRSHATLQRQAGNNFENILVEIEGAIDGDMIKTPYTTRAWSAKAVA